MYRLISESNIETDDFLEKVLSNRGIKDIESFLEPSSDSVIHYSKLLNMDKAVEIFTNTMKRESSELAVVVDSDPDGNCSAAILVSYIRDNFENVNINLIFHEGKQHGLTNEIMDEIKTLHENKKIDLLVVPDAGTSDYKQHYTIMNMDIEIIVLDHHSPEKGESEFATVVNNQLSDEYGNKQLSGVGIVYKFLEALDDHYGWFEADYYLDLVALGLIADSMQMLGETRYLVYEGLKQINNKFLSELIFKQIGDFKRVYPQTLSFAVIPKINGIIRVGSMEEKKDLFNAFCGVEETYYNTRSKKNETLPQKVTRLCINAHSRQKKARTKWADVIKEQIVENQLNKNAFLLIELDDKFDRQLGGLIAGQLANEYRKPVLMMVYDKEKEKYSGSLRGFDGAMKDTKEFLLELGLFDFVMGHSNAAGFSIGKVNFSKLNDSINNSIGDRLTGEQSINVDFYLDSSQLTTDLVEQVYEYEYLWGRGISVPLFATEIIVDTSKIKKSNSSSMIEWYHNDIKFVQFNGDVRLLDMIEDGHKVKLTLVGSLSVNHFLGKSTPQFLIEDISIGELMTDFETIEEVKVSNGLDLDDLFDW